MLSALINTVLFVYKIILAFFHKLSIQFIPLFIFLYTIYISRVYYLCIFLLCKSIMLLFNIFFHIINIFTRNYFITIYSILDQFTIHISPFKLKKRQNTTVSASHTSKKFNIFYSSNPKISCAAFIAFSTSLSSISTVTLISEVEIIFILILLLYIHSKTFAATPGLLIIPAPTTETLATPFSHCTVWNFNLFLFLLLHSLFPIKCNTFRRYGQPFLHFFQKTCFSSTPRI